MSSSLLRPEDLREARIIAIHELCPTVKSIALETLSREAFPYRAGQWLDLEIREKSGHGGFSMTSAPDGSNRVSLAVKKSAHPISTYLHDHAQVGEAVRISGGQGSCFYDPVRDSGAPLLLVAGGIGVTPLLSILTEALRGPGDQPIVLYYSAKKPDDLVFRSEIEAFADRYPRFKARFFVTEKKDDPRSDRIRLQDFTSIPFLSKANVYFCGPPPMAEAMEAQFLKLGLPPSQIRFEKWW